MKGKLPNFEEKNATNRIKILSTNAHSHVQKQHFHLLLAKKKKTANVNLFSQNKGNFFRHVGLHKHAYLYMQKAIQDEVHHIW